MRALKDKLTELVEIMVRYPRVDLYVPDRDGNIPVMRDLGVNIVIGEKIQNCEQHVGERIEDVGCHLQCPDHHVRRLTSSSLSLASLSRSEGRCAENEK